MDAHQCAYWGTAGLVGLVQRSAAKVAEVLPGSRLPVGELSLREGGQIAGHSSHQNGRDVDLGFYFVDRRGAPVEVDRLVDVRANRTARWNRQVLRFDAPRNWKLVESLITDEETDVEIILVNARIRNLVLAEARRQNASRSVLIRAARMMVIPRRREHPHLNHYHVRIFCADGETLCEDRRPLWDWTIAAREARRESLIATAPAVDAVDTVTTTTAAEPVVPEGNGLTAFIRGLPVFTR